MPGERDPEERWVPHFKFPFKCRAGTDRGPPGLLILPSSCACVSPSSPPRGRKAGQRVSGQREKSASTLEEENAEWGFCCSLGPMQESLPQLPSPASWNASWEETGDGSSTWGPCHSRREPHVEFWALGFSPSCCRGLVREPAAGRSSSDPVSQHSSLSHVLVKLLSGKMVQGTTSIALLPRPALEVAKRNSTWWQR